MNRIFYLLPAILLLFSTFSSAQSFDWVKLNKGKGFLGSSSIASDRRGNIWMGTNIEDSATIDTLKIYGKGALLSRLGSNGQLMWYKFFPDVKLKAIAADQLGSSYMTGYFDSSVSFEGKLLESQGGHDIFTARFDDKGALKWVNATGSHDDDMGVAIATDGFGNTYVAGQFHETVGFGSTVVASQGGNDFFIARYDTLGQVVWAKKGGGGGEDAATGLAADQFGNVFVTGYVSGAATFNTTTVYTEGKDDAFVSRYDKNGFMVWVRTIGGHGVDRSKAIAIDAAGRTFITGYFSDTIQYDKFLLPSNGGQDVFIASFKPDGILAWATQAGGASGSDTGLAIAVDGGSNAYIAGTFTGEMNLGFYKLKSGAGADAFVAKYGINGKPLWAKQAGGEDIDQGTSITLDDTGGVYMSGIISGQASFDGKTVDGGAGKAFFISRISQDLLGIEETGIAHSSTWLMYPNPAKNILNLMPADKREKRLSASLHLFNMLGEEVLNANIANGYPLAVDVARLPAGMYIVKIENAEHSECSRLIIN